MNRPMFDTPRLSMDIPRARPRVSRRALLVVSAALALIAAAGLGLRQLRASTPTVERSTVWSDVVRRGPMTRSIVGQGTLVAQEVRWVAAKANARVERILASAGATVTANTILLELSNSELELAALEADRQVSQAGAELVSLSATLTGQALAQQSVIASLESDLADANRRLTTEQQLSSRGFSSDVQVQESGAKAKEVAGRLDFERRRLATQKRATKAQIMAQQQQVERLRALAQFRHRELDGLRVRAGVDGVVQELTLQPGQSVVAGAPLAKVARPGRLRAEIRIPEAQAKDVVIGQTASVNLGSATAAGTVARIDPAAQNGTVRVDVTFDRTLPPGARPDINIEGTIEIERISEVLHVARPAGGQADADTTLFRIDPDGKYARRIAVKLGRSAVNTVEVRSGLAQGDRVILSDTAEWIQHEIIRLK